MPGGRSYSSGGGGTALEHQFGAALLGSLLCADTAPGLDDDSVVVGVAYQTSEPVDDFEICGRGFGGEPCRVLVGVRRDPALVASDPPSVKLLASYVRAIESYRRELRSGTVRLLLVVSAEVAGPTVDELRHLTAVARYATSNMDLRVRLRDHGHAAALTRRLDSLQHAVAATLGESAASPEDLTWLLVRHLRVHATRVQGGEREDRTAAVRELRHVLASDSLDHADALFSQLAELSAEYAQGAAAVDEWRLRRDLPGAVLTRARSLRPAWILLDRAHDRLRRRTRCSLDNGAAVLRLERPAARRALIETLAAVTEAHHALVVTGEPEVGKSALTIDCIDELISAGRVAAMVISASDLPKSGVELETLMERPLEHVLQGLATGAPAAVVLDGAEDAQSVHRRLVEDLAVACRATQTALILVARDDARATVNGILRAAGFTPTVHTVPRLDQSETAELTTTYPSLSSLAAQPGAAWVLGRLGLVELLLRHDAAIALPDSALCEADVFRVIWERVIQIRTASPTAAGSAAGRGAALIELARHQLQSQHGPFRPSEPAALDGLRADGLLDPLSAWSSSIATFASDLIRDLALARLWRSEGWAELIHAGAPRWTLRSVRLALQARVAEALEDHTNLVDVWSEFDAPMNALADRYGQRWAELSLEAVLTLPADRARRYLHAIWPYLAGQPGMIKTLLRIATEADVLLASSGSPTLLGPIIDTLLDGGYPALENTPRSEADQLILRWLRRILDADEPAVPLRARLRARLLEHAADHPDKPVAAHVEALAMLGVDLGPAAEEYLRGLAAAGGADLAPAVEKSGAVLALGRHQPSLLADLSRAYYLPKATATHQDDAPWRDFGPQLGIRAHLPGPRGLAGPTHGPFWALLLCCPDRALPLIQQMLDQAARAQAAHRARLGQSRLWDGVIEPAAQGAVLELPPNRRQEFCAGDDQVWSWYRGPFGGPYPCISALMAVERWADRMLAQPGADPGPVVELLLIDCHNLAMPGLVVGLLERHLEASGDLLAPWLVQPIVWELEFSRGAFGATDASVTGPDPDTIPGRERRSWTLIDLAEHLVLSALWAGNHRRLELLRSTGHALEERAAEQCVGATENRVSDEATAATWASRLNPDNYPLVILPDGRQGRMYQPPQRVRELGQNRQRDLDRAAAQLSLLHRYTLSDTRDDSAGTVHEDIAAAKTLVNDPPTNSVFLPETVAGVAATALRGHVRGWIKLNGQELAWSVASLLEASTHTHDDRDPAPSAMNGKGVDRSAAAGLAPLLGAKCTDLQVTARQLYDGLERCARSPYDEVRAALMEGLRSLWSAPCTRLDRFGCCHQVGWLLVRTASRDCAWSPWHQQSRAVMSLFDPLPNTVAIIDPTAIIAHRLTAPIQAAAAAAAGQSCVAEQAAQLHTALLGAHRRAFAYPGADVRNGWPDGTHHRQIIEVLLKAALKGDPGPLSDHVAAYNDTNPAALRLLLRNALELFTRDSQLRAAMAALWLPVMAQVLAGYDEDADDRPNPPVDLVPHPTMIVSDPSGAEHHMRAIDSWIDPDAISELIERWIALSQPTGDAVDSLVSLISTAATTWQTDHGLRWVHQLLDGDYTKAATRSWHIVPWLEALFNSSGDCDGLDIFHQIVDGLTAAGSGPAAELQRRIENHRSTP